MTKVYEKNIEELFKNYGKSWEKKKDELNSSFNIN